MRAKNFWIALGVAAAMAVIAFFMSRGLRRDVGAKLQHEQAREDIRRIARAMLAIYQNKLPPRKEQLWDSLELKGPPMDPWGKPYEVTFVEGGFSVITPGPDRVAGTEDDINVFVPFGGNPFEDDAGRILPDNAANGR